MLGLFTIPGKDPKPSKEDGAFAGQMFKWHKQVMPILRRRLRVRAPRGS
jgi:hypothetical protein